MMSGYTSHLTALVYDNVAVGDGTTIGAYAIVGEETGKRVPVHCVIGHSAIIRSHSVIYEGNTIGHNFHTGNGVNIREDNMIGNNVSIGTHTVVEFKVTIEDGVRIHSNAFIPEYTVLEKDCWIGPNVVITNARYPASSQAKENLEGVIVREGAKIGAGAVILPGIEIGRYALVGAGAVVTQHVPQYCVVVGNPAHVIKSVKDLKYRNQKQAY